MLDMAREIGARMSAKRRRVMWLILVGFLVLALVTIACHRSIQRHQSSIHSQVDSEEFCITTTDADGLEPDDVKRFLGRTLYDDNPSSDWDGVGGTANIYWVPKEDYYNDCSAVPYQTWIEFRYEDDPVGGLSNVYHTGALLCPIPGHCHYEKSVVILKTSVVTGLAPEPYPDGEPLYDGLARHAINHETGHVLGLLDPIVPGPAFPVTPCINCGIVSDDSSTCAGCFDGYITCLVRDPILNLVWWSNSVMHSAFYCDEEVDWTGGMPAFSRLWPASADIDKVNDIIEEYSTQ